MDETFMLFLNDIPAEYQEFVLELDKYRKRQVIGRLQQKKGKVMF